MPACRQASTYSKISFVLKKHLRDDVVGARIHFRLGISQVNIEVGGLEVLFRVAGNTDTEVGFFAVDDTLVQVMPVVHAGNLAHELKGILVPVFVRSKTLLELARIAAQRKYIVDAQKVEINECVFGFVHRKTAANQVRHSVHFEPMHDGRADTYRAGSLSDGGLLVVTRGSHLV
jgi:hypothetical protein